LERAVLTAVFRNIGDPASIEESEPVGIRHTFAGAVSYSIPAPGTRIWKVPIGAVQGNLGRNALEGFGASQVDLTLRRQFRVYERLALQPRADFFNIFNHPNFANPINLSHFSAIRAID
jgi:hypothetical protein